MSVKERKLFDLDQRVLGLINEESRAKPGFPLFWTRTKSWIYMLYYEAVKNDVAIRAESLSYFTLFSIMPLMAGVFLFLSLFSQWAPVQAEFEGLLQSFLQAIPDDQRDTLMDFILQFKDQYIAKLSHQSASIGIFALGVLVWIAGKVFFNLEALMNRIWEVKHDRRFLERIQNFILCIVIFPIAYIAALSLPGIIEHFGQKTLGVFLHQGIPTFIAFFSLTFIFRYFPNTRVEWRSAATGALVTTLGFGISSFFLSFYFHFGTQTAYGKAGILPIFAFFIYVAWLLFILGIEVSLLCQVGARYKARRFPKTTLSQALVLENLIGMMNAHFQKGSGPVSAFELSQELNVSFSDVEVVLHFLREREVIISVENGFDKSSLAYVIARAVNEADLVSLIKDFLDLSVISQNFDVFRLLNRLK
jgi:YihY family inner membrane protein